MTIKLIRPAVGQAANTIYARGYTSGWSGATQSTLLATGGATTNISDASDYAAYQLYLGGQLQITNGEASALAGLGVVQTQSALSLPQITATFDLIETKGYYSAGDGGGAYYRRVSGQPSHPGFLRDASGAFFEIAQDVIDVRMFGAKGDCPDVSTIAGVNQTAIISAVTGATNDVAAFRNALWAAQVMGGKRVTFGGDRIYRVAYSTATAIGIAIPAGCTLEGLGSSRLEIDFTLASEYAPNTAPAGSQYILNKIGCGDAATLLEPQWTSASQGIIALGGITSASFVASPSLKNVDMRCHIRMNWRALAGRGWRGFGVQFRFAKGARIIDCKFYGFPNTGAMLSGGWDNRFIRCVAERNGFGCILGGAANGLDLYGVIIKGLPNLDSHDSRAIDCITSNNYDEGLAYSAIHRCQISNITASGNLDRAIEGNGYITDTAASLGQPLPNSTQIEGVFHDGKQTLGSIAVATSAGATTITMDDAWQATANRFIFIQGATTTTANFTGTIQADLLTVTQVNSGSIVAGAVLTGSASIATGQTIVEQLSGDPGGTGRYRVLTVQAFTGSIGITSTGATDGPFLVSSVDYSAQTVTLATAESNALAVGAAVYAMSDAGVTDENMNEGYFSLSRVRLKNLYSFLGPISTRQASSGVAIIRDIHIEDTTLVVQPGGSYLPALVTADRADVTIEQVTSRRVSAPTNSILISVPTIADKVAIDNIDHNGGMSNIVSIANNVHYQTSTRISRIKSRGCGKAVILLGGYFNRVEISDCDTIDCNSENPAQGGLVTLGSTAARIVDLIVRRNVYRYRAGAGLPDAPITYPTGMPAAAITNLTCHDNDWGAGNFSFRAMHGNLNSYAGASVIANVVRDANNNVLGQRRMIAAVVPPTTGTYRRGDEVVLDLPTAGQPERCRCTTSGTFGLSNYTTSASSASTASSLSLTSVANIVVGTVLSIPGATTNGGLLTVTRVDFAAVQLNDVLGGAVASGATITPQSPVLKTAPALAA